MEQQLQFSYLNSFDFQEPQFNGILELLLH